MKFHEAKDVTNALEIEGPKNFTENRQFLEEVCRILFYSFSFPSTQIMTLFNNSGLLLREKYGEILEHGRNMEKYWNIEILLKYNIFSVNLGNIED